MGELRNWINRIKYVGREYGGYRIEEVAGEGRYSVCFFAENTQGQKVVVKKFKPSIFQKNSEKNAFEAIVLSKLRDHRFPELLGVINEQGFYAFVLERKPGITLKDMLFKQKHNFSDKDIYRLGIKIISIIKHLHGNNIVHRDIRIPNVLVDKEEVYLIDFGLSRFADKHCYKEDLDYSYLGDLLLYLLYSSFQKTDKKRQPWYEELPISNEKKQFLMKLLGLTQTYHSIYDIEMDFKDAFKA